MAGGSTGMRSFQVAVVLVLGIVFAVIPMISMDTSVEAAADSHALVHRSRHVSPFVRRNLEAEFSSSASDQSFHHALMGSSSGRVRRLAGSANCTTSPGICNTTTAGSTCCASTGTCLDLQTDKRNCGFCAYSCASSLGCCGGTCVSTLTDNLNCGSCGTTCKNSLCTGGLCGYGG